MTFKEKMIKEMINRGMFPDQAQEVIEQHICENKEDSMQGRWEDNISDYPESMQQILFVNVKETAFQWIKENAPQAWFRPMFEFTTKELTEKMNQKRNA